MVIQPPHARPSLPILPATRPRSAGRAGRLRPRPSFSGPLLRPAPSCNYARRDNAGPRNANAKGNGLSRAAKTWQLQPHDRGAIERVSSALEASPVVAQLLLSRDVRDADAARLFLDAPFRALREPDLLPGVPEAADRLWVAVRAGKKICVYGDYDADGLTGTAILVQTLRLLGAAAEFYVPHRLDEGYGLNLEALRQLAAGGVGLVVTVDCGITALAEADEARRLGLELIITDHHEPKDELPSADAVVHPRRPGSTYPFGGLSGSGVAFKLAW